MKINKNLFDYPAGVIISSFHIFFPKGEKVGILSVSFKKLAFLFLPFGGFILLGSSHCHAGAWTLEKGSMYNRIALNYFYEDKNFDKSGDKTGFPANGSFRDVNQGDRPYWIRCTV